MIKYTYIFIQKKNLKYIEYIQDISYMWIFYPKNVRNMKYEMYKIYVEINCRLERKKYSTSS